MMFFQGSWVYTIIGIITIIFIVYVLILYIYQDSFLYVPNATEGVPLPPNPLPCEDIHLKTKDGILLHCWFIRSRENSKNCPTILFLQANAGTMQHRISFFQLLFDSINCNLMILSYRGYGLSKGVPSETGIKIDAITIMKHLLDRNDINRRKIFIFGRSLGGAVAIYLSSYSENENNDICGLILENTFSSMDDMISHLFPLLSPLKNVLLKIEWNSFKSIETLKTPILFLSGSEDEIVPPVQMRKLYDNAKKSIWKKFLSFRSGKHNDTWLTNGQSYILSIRDFINSCCEDQDDQCVKTSNLEDVE